MASTRKLLGQAALAATTLTDIYTVPANTSTVVSTISVCNRGGATTFRLSHAVSGAADATKQYFSYDVALGANSVFTYTLGVTMADGDILRAYAAAATVSVNIWGEETDNTTSGTGTQIIQSASLTLTNAQIKALPVTPVQLIAAPGSGKRIKVLNGTLRGAFTAGAYTNLNATSCALAIYYLGDFTQWAQGPIVNDVTAPGSIHLTSFLGAANKVVDTAPYADWWGDQWVLPNVQSLASMNNAAVAIAADNNGSGAFTGGNVANTLKITLYYTVETTA